MLKRKLTLELMTLSMSARKSFWATLIWNRRPQFFTQVSSTYMYTRYTCDGREGKGKEEEKEEEEDVKDRGKKGNTWGRKERVQERREVKLTKKGKVLVKWVYYWMQTYRECEVDDVEILGVACKTLPQSCYCIFRPLQRIRKENKNKKEVNNYYANNQF